MKTAEQPAALRTNSLARDFRGARTIWRRELIKFFRERARVVTSFVQPLLYLLVFGTGLGAAVRQGAVGGADYRVFLLPGVVVMTCLFTSMFAAVSITWDREFGFLKEILVAPLGRAAVIAGKVAGGATTATMQGLAILVLAPLVGLRLNPLRVIAVAPILLLFALAVNSLGIAIAARISTMQGFMVIMNFITLPLFFLSGALFPLNTAPVWLRTLSYADPAAYAVDAIRRVLLGFPAAMRFGGSPVPIVWELAALAVFGAIMFAVATRGFDRQP
ncbi:MAG TPA: ABC transporter permease [Actinomycetota bacterium]|nr:ABC transporter permease [Actinomycetota bacterium]